MITNVLIHAVNDFAEAQTDLKALDRLEAEAEELESLTIDGIGALGDMLLNLSGFAQDKRQNYSEEAINNQTAGNLARLLIANSYLLRVAREARNAAVYEKAERSQINASKGTAKGGKKCAN